MTSRLGPRTSGRSAGASPVLRQQRELARVKDRQREISRSASLVSRAGALAAVAAANDVLLRVIADGYIADSQLGTGLGRPLLAMPIQPMAATSTFTTCGPSGWEQDTVSGVFETLFRHDGVRQNVCWAPVVTAWCSDVTTAGELQFVDLDTGAVLVEALSTVSVYTIPAGSSEVDVAPGAPGLLLPQEYGAPIHLGVQARRTAGTGNITLAVKQSIGG